jgi:hypothetical protein
MCRFLSLSQSANIPRRFTTVSANSITRAAPGHRTQWVAAQARLGPLPRPLARRDTLADRPAERHRQLVDREQRPRPAAQQKRTRTRSSVWLRRAGRRSVTNDRTAAVNNRRSARVCSTASDVRYRDKSIVLTLLVVSQPGHRHRHFRGRVLREGRQRCCAARSGAIASPASITRSAHRSGRSVAWPRPQKVSPSRLRS